VGRPTSLIEVYLEIGMKQTFAGALDWPGWCRSGPDEAVALQALLDYGPRYARALRQARLGFVAPKDASRFVVRERLAGNATTDFGAPDMPTAQDSDSIEDTELRHFQAVLKAGWRTFDAAVAAATGMQLRKGPRGGIRWTPRRFVRRVAWHVLDHAWEIEDRLR